MPPKFYKKKIVKTNISKNKMNIKEDASSITWSDVKYLIIVESPSKCEKIESYLGSEYCCIASKGHFRKIDGLKSIDIKNTFEPTFTLIDEKKSHIESMRNIISRFSKENIILASDDDREGEAIAWHICEVFNLPIETTKRIIFHEVTKPALQEAIKAPKTINMNVVYAQQARQILDIIVGFKISPFLWRYLFNSKLNSLSAGRCQTPALRLVYDNEKEKNANIEQKYKTLGTFFSKQIVYELNKEFDTEMEVLDFLEKSKNFQYTLSINLPKDSIKASPKPFHTSRLLQVSSNVLHISPKETMELCQKLYQSGYITYMRTESSQYSPFFLIKAEEYIKTTYGNKYVGSLESLKNNDVSNPHEAIRVTNIETTTITSSETKLVSMYKLIWKNTVESCMSEAKYNNIKTIITAPLELHYQYTIEIPVFLGWKIISMKDGDDQQSSSSAMNMYLKSIESSGKPFSYEWIESTIIVKNKHQHYTEASLINKLEELGIGRPSTFATIVDTIVDRGYVKKMNLEGSLIKCKEFKLELNNIRENIRERVFGNEKNKLVIQPTGILTIEFLLRTFEKLFSYEYTKNMEYDLDLISSGKEKNWAKICDDCLKEIKVLSKELKDTNKQSYKLDASREQGDELKEWRLMFASFGPIIIHKYVDENGEEKSEFHQVKKDINIDLEKAKRGEYKLDDLIEIKNNCIGNYEGLPMYIKSGRYGPYVEWGEKKESIKNLKKPLNMISLNDIEVFLSKSSPNKLENNILRKLNDDMSVRKGKFGPYVYYKTPNMSKPKFFNIKKFNEGFFNCDEDKLINWIKDTYNIDVS